MSDFYVKVREAEAQMRSLTEQFAEDIESAVRLVDAQPGSLNAICDLFRVARRYVREFKRIDDTVREARNDA